MIFIHSITENFLHFYIFKKTSLYMIYKLFPQDQKKCHNKYFDIAIFVEHFVTIIGYT